MELALVDGAEHQTQDLAIREELMKKRRKDQERHHRKQIWTKQPHGGPYMKVSITILQKLIYNTNPTCRRDIQLPFQQSPSGSEVSYSRPRVLAV